MIETKARFRSLRSANKITRAAPIGATKTGEIAIKSKNNISVCVGLVNNGVEQIIII